MAKTKQQSVQALKSKKHKKEMSHLHFAMTPKNYIILAIGIVVIILGYVFMSENSVDGFLPTVLAPVFLIIGYCVIIPFGILYNDRSVKENVIEEFKPDIKSNVSPASSNIKTS